ncbi:phenylalanine--tRNA ligase beta subunit-related protein [Rossellomorea sp. SC111]|uniref:B3/B4 domain-containing protein n=1 Tax=Rossellomorea sp. SC111 TaxID=2968985 RepID=UPI00215ADF21|nr:phenylalanine--tRNA ligase beta subunit-related protein [Rossellomorea sp. SC111]MCR8849490.1 phenylalanine--tRNA ligase beta subunit-related protein [Rossellomorea sp. SC111]
MEITIDSSITSKIPDFKVGFIQYHHIEVGSSPQMLKGRLQLFQESIFFDLHDKSVTELEGIAAWREIFKSTGKDPNRYRHSAEALFRRVKKQNYLTTINSAIDLNNFFSLQYEVPIGIYDCAELKGKQIELKVGGTGQTYTGLNGRENSLDNLIVACDGDGPFGSPFVDSARAPVGEETKDAVQIIFLKPSLSKEESGKLTKSLMEMFIGIHGGEGSYEVVGG